MDLNSIGLILNFFGALLLAISTYFQSNFFTHLFSTLKPGTYNSLEDFTNAAKPITKKNKCFQIINLIGFILLILGFLLQLLGITCKN